jgi:tRNA-specific 2-thiouridylase
VTVQIRAHGSEIPSTIDSVAGARASITFDEPQRGVAPGQLVAFYSGDEVLGGGTITRSIR